MTMHAMIDLETLGLGAGASILQVGVVVFTMEDGVQGYMSRNVDREDCRRFGLTEDVDTLNWWQAPERADLFARLQTGCVSLVVALSDLHQVLHDCGVEYVWANGTNFDIAILEYACRRVRINVPWKYNVIRDMRTLVHVAGLANIKELVPRREDEVSHDALGDASWQSRVVQLAWGRINVKRNRMD